MQVRKPNSSLQWACNAHQSSVEFMNNDASMLKNDSSISGTISRRQRTIDNSHRTNKEEMKVSSVHSSVEKLRIND